MKINKPEIIRRLTERLGLEPGVVAPDLNLLPVAILVTDLTKLLTDPKFIVLPLTDPGASGNYTVYTVPAGKRGHLYGAHYASMNPTTLKFDQLLVYGPDDAVPLVIQTDDPILAWCCDHPMPVAEGWSVKIKVVGWTTADEFFGSLWVVEEDLS